jgi:hypothetical protein
VNKKTRQEAVMVRARWHYALLASSLSLALATPARAQDAPAGQQAAPPAQGTAAERKARSSARDAQADTHTPVPAQVAEPKHFRGQITRVDNPSFTVRTRDGKTVRIALTEATTTISLIADVNDCGSLGLSSEATPQPPSTMESLGMVGILRT